MDDFDKKICERIKQVRTDFRLSQKDYADKLGFGQSYISDIENQRKPPTQKLIKRIIEEYEISADWLFGSSGDKSLSNSSKIITNSEKYLAHLNPDLLRTYYEMWSKPKQNVVFLPLDVSEIKLRINYLVNEGQDFYDKILKVNDLLIRLGFTPYTESEKKEDKKLAFEYFHEFVKKLKASSPEKPDPIELWSYHIELENRRNELRDRFFDLFYIFHTMTLFPEKANELRREYEQPE